MDFAHWLPTRNGSFDPFLSGAEHCKVKDSLSIS